MKKLVFLIVIFYQSAYAQSISRFVVASGSESANIPQTNLYLDWTIGEPLVKTISNSNITITEGFEQPTYKGHGKKSKEIIKIFDVFPNPTTGYITCKIKLDKNKKGILTITDLNGKLYNKLFIKKDDMQLTLDLSKLKSGIYFLSLTTKEKIITKKIIKK